jgi:hypothetical protein
MDGCDSIGRSRNCGAMHCDLLQCRNIMVMQSAIRISLVALVD